MNAPAWLEKQRDTARQTFDRLPLPTRRDVDWQRFDIRKLDATRSRKKIRVTEGQLRYEWSHLQSKLFCRDPSRHECNASIVKVQPHPLMEIGPGEIESWERQAA